MTRRVEHRAADRLSCSCGARFRKPSKLREHLAVYHAREGYGFAPRKPDVHQKKKPK